jgi:sugar phosphate isomerase/epimerase
VRESAAEVLAELGDDAGVSVLVGMLSRTRHPAGPDLPARIALDEKIRVCDLLGRLKAKGAVEALKKAARAKEAELAAAAQRAIDAIGS